MLIIKGEILRVALRTAGISQEKAAKMLGISRPTLLTRLNEPELDYDFVLKVKRVLHIDLEINNVSKNLQIGQKNKQSDTFSDSSPPDVNEGYKTNSTYADSVNIITPKGIMTSMNANRRKTSALIPFYNADFMAGFAEQYYDDGTIYPEYYMDVPEFSGCTAFRAYSDSMETRIKSGNILFGTKLDDWISHLEYGQIYGITCTDGRRYLKYIRKDNDEDNFFLLKSENPNYDPFRLPKLKIKNIWLIEGWIDKRT